MYIQIFILAIITFYMYNSVFKKKKNYPKGPWRLPIIGNLHQLGDFPQFKILEWHKKYGPIISLKFGSIETIVVSDENLIREILSHPSVIGRTPWAPFLDRSEGIPTGVIVNEGKKYIEQKNFAVKNLKHFGLGKSSMECLITAEIEELVEIILKENEAPIELNYLFNIAALNTLMVIMFGNRISRNDPEFLRTMKNLSFINPNKTSIEAATMVLPWILNISKEWSGYNRIIKSLKDVKEFIIKYVKSHEETRVQGEPRDFIDAYLDQIEKTTDKNSSFYGKDGMENLVITLFDFMLAGADTTRHSLNWICVTFATFPETQEKVREEMKRVVGNRACFLSDKMDMPYTDAFINECFRFNTLAHLGFPRRAVDDFEFHGFKISANTNIACNEYAAHNDKSSWGDPENFRPERFIDGDGKRKKGGALFPFGYGKRPCIGETFARDTIFIFVTQLIKNFRISSDPTNPEKPHLKYENLLFTTKPTYKKVSFVKL